MLSLICPKTVLGIFFLFLQDGLRDNPPLGGVYPYRFFFVTFFFIAVFFCLVVDLSTIICYFKNGAYSCRILHPPRFRPFTLFGGLMATKKDSRLKNAGVSGYNKPKRTPKHPTKSHVVVAKVGDKIKTIRFGQQGKTGDKTMTPRAKSFKARHAKNIAKGKMSAAYWANKVKW